jgi:hypothetical protein
VIMRAVFTPSTDCSSAAPAAIFPYRPRPKTTKRSPSPRRKSHFPDVASSIAGLCSFRPGARVIMVIAHFMCLPMAWALFESSVRAQTAAHTQSIDRFANFIAEASTRFTVRHAGSVRLSKLKAQATSMQSRLAARWG